MYLNPLDEPTLYLRALAERLPVLLAAQIGLSVSDVWLLLPSPARLAAYTLALLGLLAFAILLAPLWRRRPASRFWAVGAVLSLPPVCATYPMDRLLVFAGVGAMAAIALVLADWLEGGAVARLPHVRARVRDVTADGRPAEVDFTFAVPLEHPSLLWTRLQAGGALAAWSPPAVGEIQRLPSVSPGPPPASPENRWGSTPSSRGAHGDAGHFVTKRAILARNTLSKESPSPERRLDRRRGAPPAVLVSPVCAAPAQDSRAATSSSGRSPRAPRGR